MSEEVIDTAIIVLEQAGEKARLAVKELKNAKKKEKTVKKMMGGSSIVNQKTMNVEFIARASVKEAHKSLVSAAQILEKNGYWKSFL